MRIFLGPLIRLYKKYFAIWVVVLMLALLYWAFHNRFMEDDAFISFRYAQNLVDGHGLVWNPGERVEGYTNFLWTLVIAGCISFGANAAIASQIIGLACFIVSLTVFFFILRFVFQSRNIALLGTCVLGSNYTFSAFATGGLETQMQVALLLLALLFLITVFKGGNWNRKDLFLASFFLAMAALTRPDSLLPGGIFIAWALVVIFRKGTDRKGTVIDILLFITPFCIFVGGWILWKCWYYGDVLPNTFYSKIMSPTSMQRGLYYIHSFFASYLLYPFVLILIVGGRKLFRKENAHLIVLFATVVCWMGYIIITGGDHMEFRFFVPVFPLIVILFVWLLFDYVHQAWLRASLVLLILAGTIDHTLTFAESTDPAVAIAPLRQYEGTFTREDEQWTAIGKTLHELFPDSGSVRIATTAAGAIPYYSRLPAVDMLGINDSWVARHGVRVGTTPGHQRMSPMSYLVARGVNLLIAHPIVVESGAPLKQIPIAPMDSIVSFPKATFLYIPIDAQHSLVTMYLKRNNAVDKAIESGHWEIIEAGIKPSGEPG